MEPRPPDPLVRVCGLSKTYVQRRWFSRRKFVVHALSRVNMEIFPHSTFALVGESGSGKSTLARCLARLEEPTSGEIWFEGTNLTSLTGSRLAAARQKIQLIFQDSAVALNPGLRALEIISEPLAVQERGTEQQRRERALELMEQVGLLRQWANKFPLDFSGGQRQRLAIARALTLQAKFLILDEALSGLDLSVQAQIVNLLLELQARHSLTYLYISHDLSLVGHLADQIAVMRKGEIVEQAQTSELLTRPRDPYTRDLLASVLRI